MRFSTSSRNAQFPRLFLRAFQKWTNSRFILTARSKLSKTSCAQQNHATTIQNGMKSRVLFSHTTAMSQTCAKLKENSKQSARALSNCFVSAAVNWYFSNPKQNTKNSTGLSEETSTPLSMTNFFTFGFRSCELQKQNLLEALFRRFRVQRPSEALRGVVFEVYMFHSFEVLM